MNKLSEFAVENRRAIIFTTLLLSLIGGYLLFRIPEGVFPDATFPRIAIEVDYGLAPLKEMEMRVAKPIEEAMMMVEGVRTVRASISRGALEVNVDFQWGQDMFRAYQLVQAQVSGIQHQLPPGVKIEVRRFTTSTYPVAGFALTSDKRNLLQLRDLAIFTIRPQLAAIPGVYNIEVMGGHQREYWVNLDPQKLVALHLDYKKVEKAIRQANNLQFVGRLNESNKLYLNIADNRFVKMEDIEKTIVAHRGVQPVFLSDIATVKPAVKETFIACESNLKPAVLITVIKQPGTNAVSIMKTVEKRLASLKKVMPPDVRIQKWYDMTDFIRGAIGSVRDAIFLGAFLTFLILLLFLKKLRITLVTVTIIPVALLISFIFIKLSGMNLNIMSLGGLAAAIGILTDNAIVVIENVERYLEEGFGRKEAVIRATSEIIPPLLGATLTTLVVFVPLVFLSGVPGIFFKALASTLAIAVVVSMLLAVFLTPALTVSFISTRKKKPGKFMPVLVNLQQKALKGLMRWPVVTLLVVLIFAAVAVFSYLRIPNGFLPEWDEGTIVHDYLAPPGSSIEATKKMLKPIAQYIMSLPDVESYSLRTGRSLAHPRTHTNDGDFVIMLKKGHKLSSFEIMDKIRAFDRTHEPRLQPELFQVLPDRLKDLSGEIAPITIKVFGENLALIRQTAAQIADSLKNIRGAVDVYKGFSKTEPELRIRVNEEAAARFGVSVKEVSDAVHMALWGDDVSGIMEGLKMIPVRVRYPKQKYLHAEAIKKLPVYLASINRVVRLGEIADIQKLPGKADVDHENLAQVVNVKAHIAHRDLGSIIRDVKTMLAHIPLPPGVTLDIGGQYKSQQEAFRQLIMILSLGILLVFAILLFEFKSFRTSGVILLGTVLSVSGVFLLLWITRIPLDISAFMGMIMIIGVVVNNGILLIDYTEKYLKENSDVQQALLMAGQVRMRPILMTMLATIFGFLPLALALGEGSEMLQPLAVSMIGGMMLSIFLSLLIIPALYWMVNRNR
ncbi:efflux RND transporter permease subunit [Candidatus Sulfidibacterium hydrothermale]|uniref:efflux RND transporter permease subunit n=1 Tax=Candidatus Sulfidibacterium hydrothermale TaxID=2875962 RepID=UPI001F0B5B83|nr:efflux RND transporter permease subunit [Candidatus Sulfidibacterium hydrothermale]UBM63411.1 efflux RND transporter permease subunit [Candidatus Sulfidibacterium hydrothermale]